MKKFSAAFHIRNSYIALSVLLLITLSSPENVLSWSPSTHTFIAKKAGIPNPEYANFADLFKKENKALLGPFHYHNAAPHTKVTPEYIDQFQIKTDDYVKAGRIHSGQLNIRVPDPAGVLYWKILELYQEMNGKTGWEYEYYLLNIAHYISDLSNPLHNFPHGNGPASNGKIYPQIGAWAKENHEAFDRILESCFPLDRETEKTFDAWIVVPSVISIHDLKREIAKIANSSIALANRCYAEKRILTLGEALKQTAMSVSLLKALMADTKRIF